MDSHSLLWRIRPDEEKAACEILLDWHRLLNEENRGDRAALRRAPDLDAVLLQPTLHRLRFRLSQAGFRIPGRGPSSDRRRAFAAFVALAADVREHVEHPKCLGDLLAQSKTGEGSTPLCSELRFRRWIALETVEELLRPTRRLLRLLQGRVHLFQLADTVYNWSPPTRAQLAESYYGHKNLQSPNQKG